MRGVYEKPEGSGIWWIHYYVAGKRHREKVGRKSDAIKPTLEINPDHEIVKKLVARPGDSVTEDAAWLLFDPALLMEGVPLKDPASFVQRLNRVLNLSI